MSYPRSEWPGRTALRQAWTCIGAHVLEAPFRPDTTLDVSTCQTPDDGALITICKDGTLRWLFHVTADDLAVEQKRLRCSGHQPADINPKRRTRMSTSRDLQEVVCRLLVQGTCRGNLQCTIRSRTADGTTMITIFHPDGVVNAVLTRDERLSEMTPKQREARRYLDELEGNEQS